MGSFREFLGKDLRRNIDVHRDTVRGSADMETRKDPASFDTAVSPIRHVHLRRASEMPTNLLSESAVSDIPVKLKPLFGTNQESGEGWSPPDHPSHLTHTHRIDYNPITCLPLPYASLRTSTNIDARRRNGITEIADKQHLFHSNPNPAHSQALASDPRTFHYRQGVFMHMWEVSARQGFLNRPFPLARRKSPVFRC